MFIYELISLTTLGWEGAASSDVPHVVRPAMHGGRPCSLPLKLSRTHVRRTGKLGELGGLAAGGERSLETERMADRGGVDISPTCQGSVPEVPVGLCEVPACLLFCLPVCLLRPV